MQNDSGILRVVRTSQFVNRGRRIAVWVDGREVGTVGNGETMDFAVSVGEHDVHAEIDSVCSQTVRVGVAAETPVTLRLSSPLTGWKVLRTQEALSGPPGSFISLEALPGVGSDSR